MRYYQLLLPIALLALSGCASVTPQTARQTVVSTAVAQVGVPYAFGHNDGTGFDDSGLVFYAYKKAGFLIPRYPEGQLRAGRVIPYKKVRPADLLFYRIKKRTREGGTKLHVGIYIGNNEMVHLSRDQNFVAVEKVDNDYWFKRMVAVVKILP